MACLPLEQEVVHRWDTMNDSLLLLHPKRVCCGYFEVFKNLIPVVWVFSCCIFT
jgi:hypothetical protein